MLNQGQTATPSQRASGTSSQASLDLTSVLLLLLIQLPEGVPALEDFSLTSSDPLENSTPL